MIPYPDSHRDLLDAEVATLATIGADGHPQLSEVWFLAEGDVVRLSLNSTRQKVKNLQRDPACALLLLDLDNPQRYVEIRGTADIQPDEAYEFGDRVGAKYAADLRTMDKPGESRVVVTVEPTRIRSWG
jgi:PPOX class probable F420-dependent enzyme